MDYSSMTKDELIAALEALAKRNAALQQAQTVTNKQVYTAVRNYVVNELGIKDEDVKAIITAGVSKAVDALVTEISSSQALARIEERVDKSVMRTLEGAVKERVSAIIKDRLVSGRMTVDIKFAN